MSGDADSIRDARLAVATALESVPTPLRDAVVLIAHELVTNAVVHGGGCFFLQLSANCDRVRVEVSDVSGTVPKVFGASEVRDHGRGMAIVDAIASEWGVEEGETHKTVWFEVALAA